MKLRNPESLRAFVGKGEGRVITVVELAKQLDRTRSTIDHLLSGRRSFCSPELAAQVEEIIGVPPGIIFLPASGEERVSAA